MRLLALVGLFLMVGWNPLQAEEAQTKVSNEPDREKLAQQMAFLAGSLDHLPQVPEMHHTIMLPEEADADKQDQTLIHSKKGERS